MALTTTSPHFATNLDLHPLHRMHYALIRVPTGPEKT